MDCRPRRLSVIVLQLRPGDIGHKGRRWDLLLDGEVIVSGSLVPGYDAARVLQARGLTGSFQVLGVDGRVSMTYPDIEIAAKYTIAENEKHGPRLVKYRSFADAAFMERFKLNGGQDGLPDPDEAS